MDLGSLLLIVALMVLVALVVARPLVTEEQLGPGRDSQASHWLAEREQALDALLELDFDHSMNKVPDEVYAAQRARLVAQAGAAMQSLDRLEGAGADAPASDAARPATLNDTQLDKLLAARRKARRK